MKKKLFGKFLGAVGVTLFLLTFWLPIGFPLGGEAAVFGFFLPELEVIFPLCGVGVLCVFFGQFLSKTQKKPASNHILFWLIWLVLSVVAAFFVWSPEKSILFLLIWITGILASTSNGVFFLKNSVWHLIFSASILTGILIAKIFPGTAEFWFGQFGFFPAGVPELLRDFSISMELLGMGAVLGILFLAAEEKTWWQLLLFVFYAWVAAESGNFVIVSLAFFTLFLGRRFFFSKTREQRDLGPFWGPLAVLSFFIGWGFFEEIFSLDFSQFFPQIRSISQWIFGVGEGQFFTALQRFSETILTPDAFQFPTSGMSLVLAERGIVGVVLTAVFLFSGKFCRRQKTWILPIFLLLFLFGSAAAVGTENGILFLAIFALTEAPEKK
ncbi:hypothetical protein HN954_01515 [bacterium]|jgi:hypothetical protein|nr:hypothetical protein [bacterium]MBT6832416.1 hypothetical protein [bacterium]MBT6996087.1 hypothetical protein [bacterium]MBT7772536.1 hypothetical protein [bacterium]